MLRIITSADEFKDIRKKQIVIGHHIQVILRTGLKRSIIKMSRERERYFFFSQEKEKKKRKKYYTPQTLFRESLRRGVKEREAKEGEEEEEEEEEDSAELSLCGVRREDIKHKTE